MASPVLSIVAPAYNEERNIPAFLAAIIPVLEGIGETFEIIFVNDGSRDNTLGLLAAAASQDARIKVIGLARNFGKDVALSAGLAHASGNAVIPIDCDLQHPPQLIPAFVAKWREGYDMVLGVRSKRDEEGYVRRTLSRTYYKVMRFMTSVEIPPNAGDFRLLDRKILDVINKMPERHRFMKGIFAWPGFKVASIEFQANVRANETRSTWSFFKLWRFALDGLFSFSTAPLKLWTYIGALSAGGAFLYLLITIIQKLFWGIAVPGYASLLIVVLFLGGLLLISNGIQGEYIARIFEEVKGRPLYVIGSTFGFDAATLATAAAPRASVPSFVPGQSTAPHAAPPPPPINPNATQVGIATGPVSPPAYPPPMPVPASGPLAMSSGPHVAPNATPPPQPLPRTKSPTASPSISEPRTKTPSTPPATEPRAKTPSMSPPVAGEPRAKTPSMSPPVASHAAPASAPNASHAASHAAHAAPSSPSSTSHATTTSGSHAAPPAPPPANDRSSARLSRPPSAQPVSGFGPTAPTAAVAPTATVTATPSPAVTAPGMGAAPANAPGLGAAPATAGDAEPTAPTAAPPSETPARPKRELPKPTKGPAARS